MNLLAHNARRLARRVRDDERGMTIIELMIGIAMGTVVTMAAFLAMDSAAKMQIRTQNRVDSVQRGRNAMETITRSIRAQQCFNGTRPMLWASGTGMEFYSSIAPKSATTFQPTERHVIKWIANATAPKDISNGGAATGTLMEYIYRANNAGTFPSSPTQTRTLANDVEQAPDRRNTSVLAPIFRYYKYSAATGSGRVDYTAPVAMSTTQNGVASAAAGDLAGIVLVEISFRATQRQTNQAKAAAMNFYNTVSVRIADPTNPGGSPQCL